MWTIGFFIFGLLFGSFANVIIFRLPNGKSIVKPRSFCYRCKHTIYWYDNIPILSWLFLRGKCRQCKQPISYRYPLVEFIMGVLFAITYNSIGWSWLLLEYIVFIFGLVVVSFIDLDHMILPDEFTLSGIILGLIGGYLNPQREFLPAFFGVLFGGGFLWTIAYIYERLRKQEGMGGGDIKLIGWIGAILGIGSFPFVIIVSSFLGSVIGLLLIIKNRGGMSTQIPFGPFLAVSALLYLLIGGNQIHAFYLKIFGLDI